MKSQIRSGGTIQQTPIADVADRVVSGVMQSPVHRPEQRVRFECEKAAIGDETIHYLELARTVFGVGNQHTLRRLNKILCENMRDDLHAGRPFSSVAVRRVDNNMPGIGFFECANDLRRLGGDDDAVGFVAQEWAAYRRSLGIDLDDDAAAVLC